jgi:hypothetical protein
MADLDGYIKQNTSLHTPGLETRNFQLVACRWNNNCTTSLIIVNKSIKKTHYLAKYLNVEHVIKYSYVQTKFLSSVLGEKQVFTSIADQKISKTTIMTGM